MNFPTGGQLIYGFDGLGQWVDGSSSHWVSWVHGTGLIWRENGEINLVSNMEKKFIDYCQKDKNEFQNGGQKGIVTESADVEFKGKFLVRKLS